tara:strand:+ start:680 stop:1276 length:597 start_codon:yes stop_codon:yes gene_type:complete
LKLDKKNLVRLIAEELGLYQPTLSEGLKFHQDNELGVNENIFRPGSVKFFNLFREVRRLAILGHYNLTEEESYFINETDIGEFGVFEGERVPLDFPMVEQDIDEAKKKKKDPPLNKPSRNSGSGKKYKVFVRAPGGGVRKVTFGDKKGGLTGNWNDPKARKAFADRHNCAEKKDKTKAGYWACRAHKYFGNNVPGRFW